MVKTPERDPEKCQKTPAANRENGNSGQRRKNEKGNDLRRTGEPGQSLGNRNSGDPGGAEQIRDWRQKVESRDDDDWPGTMGHRLTFRITGIRTLAGG